MAEDADLHVRLKYWVPPDPASYEGVIERFTSQILVFRTDRALRPGQAITFSVMTVQGQEATSTRALPAQVEKVRALEGAWEVIAAYSTGEAAKMKEKRRTPRHPVDLRGQYAHASAQAPIPCKVRDISRQGARLLTQGGIRKLEKVHLTIFPPPKGILQKIIQAEFLVLRCRHLGKGVYEAGGKFITVQMEADGNGPPAESAEQESGP
jgi:hypothetical protein